MANLAYVLAGGRSIKKNVIGGGESRAISFQVSIQARSSLPDIYIGAITYSGWSHSCGGAIVTNNYIVTAAHCLNGFKPSDLSMLVGSLSLNSGGGTRYFAQQLIIHPQYKEVVSHDIGLIRTTKLISFTQNVKAIAYDKVVIPENVNCILYGWGSTINTYSPSSNTLKEANTTTISNNECGERDMAVTNTELCTLSNVGKGSCTGDSGGPLVCNNKLGGLVAYGYVVCANGSPDVYTRVSELADWIDNNVKNNTN